MTKKQILEIVVVLVVIVGALYWGLVLRGKNTKDIKVIQEASTAIEQVTGNTPAVAPSSNPAASVVPAVNPIEKTNPFKNEYQNPFK